MFRLSVATAGGEKKVQRSVRVPVNMTVGQIGFTRFTTPPYCLSSAAHYKTIPLPLLTTGALLIRFNKVMGNAFSYTCGRQEQVFLQFLLMYQNYELLKVHI